MDFRKNLSMLLALITIIFALAFHTVGGMYIKTGLPQESQSEAAAGQVPTVCDAGMACGWEVYTKNLRQPSYFVFSPCRCPEQTRCVRDQESVDINSYVHRCKSNDPMDLLMKSIA